MAIMKRFKGMSCAVLGNSGNLLGSNLGEVVEAHDVVRTPPPNQGSTRPLSPCLATTPLENSTINRFGKDTGNRADVIRIATELIDTRRVAIG
eukprot:6765889-Pyramimonas_sp.AAC.1